MYKYIFLKLIITHSNDKYCTLLCVIEKRNINQAWALFYFKAIKHISSSFRPHKVTWRTTFSPRASSLTCVLHCLFLLPVRAVTFHRRHVGQTLDLVVRFTCTRATWWCRRGLGFKNESNHWHYYRKNWHKSKPADNLRSHGSGDVITETTWTWSNNPVMYCLQTYKCEVINLMTQYRYSRKGIL